MIFYFYKKINHKSNSGFSVPEMIVSLFFFSMIMVIAVSTVLAVSTANRKVFAITSVNNSLVYALDSMIRDIRTGRDYDCGPADSTKNCSLFLGFGTPSSSFFFTDDRGQSTGYRLSGTVIQKLIGGTFLDITPAEVRVNKLDFYVDGVGGAGDNLQPHVIVVLSAESYYKNQKVASFNVETMATQRLIEGDE